MQSTNPTNPTNLNKIKSIQMIGLIGLLLFSLCFTISLYARETGAPLVTFPIKPCRVFDTRVQMGPIPANTSVNLHVRGSNLPPAQGGPSNCGVPSSAEAVIANVVVIMPSSYGHLIVDYPIQSTSVSRINYNPGMTVANEMTVSLCNANVYPLASHIPCLWSQDGTVYLDAQIMNVGSSGVNVLVDVVGYLKAV